MAKRAHLSSSVGGSSRKKAQRKPEAEIPLQGASQPGSSSAEFEEEEEVAPPLIQSRCSKGPATLKGITVVEVSQPELR